MNRFWDNVKQAIMVSFIMFVVCGLIYPVTVTGIAQGLFKHQANGSIVEVDGKAVGSEKLGQAFTSAAFFEAFHPLTIMFIHKKILYQITMVR